MSQPRLAPDERVKANILVNQMYDLIFESSEEAEHFRQYLKENADIDLPQAHERIDELVTQYEFESYGYPGFVMTMVQRICFNGGVDYAEMSRLP
jgi:hypothetical protein